MNKSFLLLLLCTAIFLITGCQEKQPASNGDTVNLTYNKAYINNKEILKTSQITGILGNNTKGQLLGFLDNSGENNLYLINPPEKQAYKITSSKDGRVISCAVMNDRFLIWVEKDLQKWEVVKKDLQSGYLSVIDNGEYFNEGGNDYPSISLYNQILSYNTSEKGDSGVLLSKIYLYDADNDKKEVIAEQSGKDTFLGAPSISDGFVVWHRGEWTEKMNAETYLYNLKTKEKARISGKDPAITPVIWDKFVVWNSYKPGNSEVKNIEIYNISTGETKFVTNNKQDSRMESWGPSISNGYVTWRSNKLMSKIEVFSIISGEVITLNSPTYYAGIYGDWLVWIPTDKNGNIIPGYNICNLKNWG